MKKRFLKILIVIVFMIGFNLILEGTSYANREVIDENGEKKRMFVFEDLYERGGDVFCCSFGYNLRSDEKANGMFKDEVRVNTDNEEAELAVLFEDFQYNEPTEKFGLKFNPVMIQCFLWKSNWGRKTSKYARTLVG